MIAPREISSVHLRLNEVLRRLDTVERTVRDVNAAIQPIAPPTGGGESGASGNSASSQASTAIATKNAASNTQRANAAPFALVDPEIPFNVSTGVFAVGNGLQNINGTISTTAQNANLQAARITTGSIPASSTVNVTLTWNTPFADANYTPTVSVLDSLGNLEVIDVISYNASQIVVAVHNNDAGGAHTGTLLAIAVHD